MKKRFWMVPALGLSVILAFSGCSASSAPAGGSSAAPSESSGTASSGGETSAAGQEESSGSSAESAAAGEQAGEASAGGEPSGKTLGRFTVLDEYADGDWEEVTFTMTGAESYDADQQAAASVPRFAKEEYPEVDGSTATLPLSRALYSASTGASAEEAEQNIQHYKTTQSYYNLLSGYTSLVIAYRPPESFFEELANQETELEIEPIGRDALVFMKNETNPVKSLTGEELKSIYKGEIKNWKEIGGEDKPIVAFQRPSGSGSQTLMENLVMQGDGMADAPQDWVVSEMGELLEKTASYNNSHNALGYSVYYYAKNMYEIPGLGFMAVDGVMPENDTIRTGEYPYVNDFYTAIRKDEPENSPARQLFNWLRGTDGQIFVESLGYVASEDVKYEAQAKAGMEFDGSLGLPAGKAVFLNARSTMGSEGMLLIPDSSKEMTFIRDYSLETGDVVVDLTIPQIVSRNTSDEANPVFSGVRDIAGRKWVLEPADGAIRKVKSGLYKRSSSEKTEYFDENWNLLFSIPNPGTRDEEGWMPGQTLVETPHYVWNFDYMNRKVEIYDQKGVKTKELEMDEFGREPWPEANYNMNDVNDEADYGESFPVLHDMEDYQSGRDIYREDGEKGFSAADVSARAIRDLGVSPDDIEITGVMSGERVYELTYGIRTDNYTSALYDAVKGALISLPPQNCTLASDISVVMNEEYDREYLVLPDGSIPMNPSGKPYTFTADGILWSADGGGISVREADGREFVLPGNYEDAWLYHYDEGYEIGWYDSDGNSYSQFCVDGKIVWTGAADQNFSSYYPDTGNLKYWDGERNRHILIDKDGKEIEEDTDFDPYWTNEDRDYGVTIGYFASHLEIRDSEGRLVAAFSDNEAE